MAQYRPRRRDAPSRPDDSYMPYDPYGSYERDAPPDRDPYAYPPAQSPPRRHKSERHRRPPSPGPYYGAPNAPDGPPAPSRRRPARDEPPVRGRSPGPPPPPSAMRRGPSPPAYVPDHDSPRRRPRSSRPERDPYLAEPDPYRRERSRPRSHTSDPRDRPSRTHPRSSEPDFAPRSSRNTPRAEPPEARSRGRPAYHPASDGEDEYGAAGARRRRPRSQTRPHDRGLSPTSARRPPPTSRGREPTSRGKHQPPARRSSMPATTKARSASWWQNPMVQAGARTAFTAGAQAAMKSRNDPSPWLGAKGAKIATAALGAALVDGFMGQKHPNGARHKVMREGVDVASGKVGRSSRHH